jgi:NAD+ kinase
VVVEEGPAKAKTKKPSYLARSSASDHGIQQPKKSPDSVDEDEEDEDEEDDEDEDDKYDINDSSPEAALPAVNSRTAAEVALGIAKAQAQEGVDPLATPEAAAAALHNGNAYMRSAKARAKSRSRSRSRFRSNSHSGVDTPGRFAGPIPHPPRVSRQVEFATPLSPSRSSDSLEPAHPAQHGARDDIYAQRSGHSSGKSRIPRDRDVDSESMNLKTPTVADILHGGRKMLHHGHSPEHEHYPHHRAFAVWGQDESDSNASDSDA